MMKKRLLFLLLLISLLSCEKDVPKVNFSISLQGFEMHYTDSSTAFSSPEFHHKFSGGTLRFSGRNKIYDFQITSQETEHLDFSLPPGDYSVDFYISPASVYGQKYASFIANASSISITESTDTIVVKAESNCALFLVSDENNQLTDGAYMIERYESGTGYFRSYPLSMDTLTGLYYCYFTPDPNPANPSAFLWFYKGEKGPETGGLSTIDCEIGFMYYIEVLD